jgi:hypothetical protein
MQEIWKDIKGYEGIYQVSNLGNVKSLTVSKSPITPYKREGKILKPVIVNSSKPYVRVSLCKYSQQKLIAIHRLVATAFIPNPDNKPLGHTFKK